MVAGFQFMNMVAGFCYYTESSIEVAGTPTSGLFLYISLCINDLLLHMSLAIILLLHMGHTTDFLLHMGPATAFSYT